MVINFVGEQSIEDVISEAITIHGNPLAAVFLTYTFDCHFFEKEVIPLFQDPTEIGLVGARFRTLVVCDKRVYTGHSYNKGYALKQWETPARLFHPKVYIVAFRKTFLTILGSGNLTASGWRHNREFFSVISSEGIPFALMPLLKEIKAPQHFLSATPESSPVVTSFQRPIDDRLFEKLNHMLADEIHVVSPFYDKYFNDIQEDAEDLNQNGSDSYSESHSFLRELLAHPATRHLDKLHLYIPYNDAIAELYAPRSFVEDLEKFCKIRSIQFNIHGVPLSGGQLHAKLVAIKGLSRGEITTLLLAGSPNCTSKAMSGRGKYNVEAAVIVKEQHVDLPGILAPLDGPRWRSFADIKEMLTSQQRKDDEMSGTLSAIESARLTARGLQITWKKKYGFGNCRIRYENAELTPASLRKFRIKQDCFLDITLKKGNRQQLVAIDIPEDDSVPITPDEGEIDPEQWLARLGSIYGEQELPGTGGAPGKRVPGGGSGDMDKNHFHWAGKVRNLASKLRYLESRIADDAPWTELDCRNVLALFSKTFYIHSPSKAKSGMEKHWRHWARFEILNSLQSLNGRVKDKTYLALTRRLRRKLAMHFKKRGPWELTRLV